MYGEDIISCSGQQFFLMEDTGLLYAVAVKGDISKTAENNNITINGFEITPGFKEAESNSNTATDELNTLIAINSEQATANKIPGSTVESQFRHTPNGKPLLLIWSDIKGMPVSANLVFGNRVLTLSTIVKAKDIEKARQLLQEIMDTAVTVSKKEDLCKK